MEETINAMRQTDDILILNFRDKNELYEAYMSFVSNGGLFVASNNSYQLGDEVFLLVKLWDEPEKISLTGQVVWITPPCAQGGREAGVGVQFVADENSAEFRRKIENALAGLLGSDKKTNTL